MKKSLFSTHRERDLNQEKEPGLTAKDEVHVFRQHTVCF